MHCLICWHSHSGVTCAYQAMHSAYVIIIYHMLLLFHGFQGSLCHCESFSVNITIKLRVLNIGSVTGNHESFSY